MKVTGTYLLGHWDLADRIGEFFYAAAGRGTLGPTLTSQFRGPSPTKQPQASLAMSSAAPWRWPVPRPLQRLFDGFPLRVYESTDLPARAELATSSSLATLFVFSSPDDARLGNPSYNPGCLKWQTYLCLAGIPTRLLPSTNHASLTGSLPFLLPLRTTPLAPSPTPLSPAQFIAYAQKQGRPLHDVPPAAALRAEAFQSLIDIPLRNAWLYALYLDKANTHLLDKWYTAPASSSPWIRDSLRHQLRRAAEAEILKTGSYLSSVAAGMALVDAGRVYQDAEEALEALAGVLGESGTDWFFGAEGPGIFDCSVFAYTYLMMVFMAGEGGLGRLVKRAGRGELEGHKEKVFRLGWRGEKEEKELR